MDLNKIPENAENSKKECAVTAVLQQLVRGFFQTESVLYKTL